MVAHSSSPHRISWKEVFAGTRALCVYAEIALLLVAWKTARTRRARRIRSWPRR